MSDAPSIERRLAALEDQMLRMRRFMDGTYALLMGRIADTLRQRWERTQQELSVPVRRADLHSHTTYSDGRDSVAEMDHWRARIGLDVLAVTDHNTLKHCPDCTPFPRLLTGEEVTGRHHHVLVHGAAALIDPEHHLHREVANIRAAGRMPLVAHPTGWMGRVYDEERIASVRELEGAFLMEIANGAGNWYDYRDSTDETAIGLWDDLLLAGKAVVGVGDSDAHRAPDVGLVWNGVVEESTDPERIYAGVAAGRAFVSNGPAALFWADGVPPGLTPRAPAAAVQLRLEVADSEGVARWRIVADGHTWQEGDGEGRRVIRLERAAPALDVRSYRLEAVAADGRLAYSNPVRFAS